MSAKILIFLLFSCVAWGGNLVQIINLAQSAKLEEYVKFNQINQEDTKNKLLNIDINARYKLSKDLSKDVVLRSGGITARIEYLLFDGGEREAANKILLYKNANNFYKNDEFLNLISFQVGKIYFNAIAIAELINIEQERLELLKELSIDASFWLEFNDIGFDEFAALGLNLKNSQETLEELLFRQNELLSRISLLSDASINFEHGSSVIMPKFDNKTSLLKLNAIKQEKIIKKEEEKQEKSRFAPKVYLKDFQHLSADDLKIGNKSGSEAFDKYLDANKPMIEFKWDIPNELSLSRQRQEKRVALLSANEEEDGIILKLKAIKKRINKLDAMVKIDTIKQLDIQKNLKTITQRYAEGKIEYREFFYLFGKNFDDRINFILNYDEMQMLCLEYYYEAGDEILKRIFD
ncbi:hypothetical protein [Campylobacter californiensis]|uniref:hypothetical protein n=1 Tax=Campylobacter californiensis TaxID=1032243 RepID=UPI001474AD8B|nr:hypothetical protein [Campylobacter sp. RM12916]MBE3610633.1 hypothetical protein [Campylobacter sp. RM12916]